MKQLILFLLCLSTWTAQAKIYNVKDYGAKADGTTIDTPAINRAIEEAASQGGGTLYFPAGEYACYSIRLASHIHLYIEQGAQLSLIHILIHTWKNTVKKVILNFHSF